MAKISKSKKLRSKSVKRMPDIDEPVKMPPNLIRRPYGLLSNAGIASRGLTPREAWGEWNEYRRQQAAAKKQSKNKNSSTYKIAAKSAASSSHQTGYSGSVNKNVKPLASETKTSSVIVPELNSGNISTANSNSMFNRGDHSNAAYKAKVQAVLEWDIPDSKKQQIINELHKRSEKLLRYEAQHVPWTVSGPARYNAKKFNKSKQVMSEMSELSDWFNKTEQSVKNSRTQYKQDFSDDAKREEEWFNRSLQSGWHSRGGKLNPTSVANGLAAIAQYDEKRFVELYEKYDKELKFKSNTNAAKLYQSIKAGTYKSAKKSATKLHESESYNAYKKTIKAGERAFLKFTTRPKPQMVYALKKRGWHWNSLEEAWSIEISKYDPDYVKEIESKYSQYL